MVTCPYCGRPAMSHWRKLGLGVGGPGQTVRCQACGKPVGVSVWSLVAFLPFGLSFYSIGRLHLPWFFVWMTSGVLLYVWVHTFIVPLVRRTP